MNRHCIAAPEVLLPAAGVDLYRWAVIACDQHTSDAAYWRQLEALVGDAPSTLRLTLPEIYLEEDCAARVEEIARTMRAYRDAGVFRKLEPGFILVERKTQTAPLRTGVVIAVDLEAYSFEKKSSALIRATEATIVERIPPRLKIREAAVMEFPHVMLLYDDPADSVLGPWKGAPLEVLYDTELNMGGGHVTGKRLPDTAAVISAFEKLEKGGMLFMVGDGNHSLATAKAAWDKIKGTLSEEEQKAHPARFALCEAVNIHDAGIRFEAIHRLVKGVDAEDFSRAFAARAQGEGSAALYAGGRGTSVRVPAAAAEAVAETDRIIAAYIAEHGGSVDYVHGEEALRALTAENAGYVGIALPAMDKSELFDQVLRGGSLPRKTFSMGESEEKRYYMEGKEITNETHRL